MAALLGDTGLIHHHDAVGVADGGQPMRDDQGGSPACQFRQGTLDGVLGFGIEGRGGFVQDQDRRVFEEHARNRQALFLTTRQFHPALADHGIQTVRQRSDGAVELGAPCGLQDLGFRRIKPAIENILAQGAAEQEHVLLHDADLAAQRFQGHRADIHPIDGDAAGLCLIEARQQGAERGLAGAGGADEGHRLAGGNAQIDMP